MPDKVEDVKRPLTHGPLQVAPSGALEPGEFEQAGIPQRSGRGFDPLLLALNVQRRAVARTGDQAQNGERKLDGERLGGRSNSR